MRTWLLMVICAVILLPGCRRGADAAVNPADALGEVMTDYHEGILKLFPTKATYEGDNRYNDRLSNSITQVFENDLREFNNAILERLSGIDRSALSITDMVSYDILKWECGISNDNLDINDELLPVNQLFSTHLFVAQLGSGSSVQPFVTVEDYDNWLSRLDDFLEWTDTAMANMRLGIDKGYTLPRSLIEKMIPQMDDFTSLPVEGNIFYMPIAAMPEEFPVEDRDRLRVAYSEMIEYRIAPKYEAFKEFLVNEYLPAGKTSSGISAVPGGSDMYDFYIRYYTTTSMTADEIYALGEQEVARIRTEMQAVMDAVGFKGSIREFCDYVRDKPELTPYTDPQQAVDHFNTIHETMKPYLDQLFDKVPKCPFEVRRTEAFRETTSTWEYNQGSPDGSRPGIFYVPVPDVGAYNIFQDEALFLHEAIPGHHYQISLQQENEDLPAFRKTLWYSAYGEGWALYTESLGSELGLYTDPYQYFGMLSMEMHRALRLVIDIGIHLKGWSREQAIEYSLDNEAEPEYSIISEVERYMAAPGQALSYKIGQLKIRELRAHAETELGDKFDIREFHNRILEPGCVPLAILESIILDWIAAQKRSMS